MIILDGARERCGGMEMRWKTGMEGEWKGGPSELREKGGVMKREIKISVE